MVDIVTREANHEVASDSCPAGAVSDGYQRWDMARHPYPHSSAALQGD